MTKETDVNISLVMLTLIYLISMDKQIINVMVKNFESLLVLSWLFFIRENTCMEYQIIN